MFLFTVARSAHTRIHKCTTHRRHTKALLAHVAASESVDVYGYEYGNEQKLLDRNAEQLAVLQDELNTLHVTPLLCLSCLCIGILAMPLHIVTQSSSACMWKVH